MRTLHDVVSSQGLGVQTAHGASREDIMNRRFRILIWCMQNKKALFSLLENVLV